MEVSSLLIAETDPAVLLALSEFISSHLPQIDIHLADSPDQAHRKLSQVRYLVAVVAPNLVPEKASLRLHTVRNRSVLMPVLMTATLADVDAAREALLYRGAFDVITKPLHPIEALQSIRVALWHARFLGLLTQQERTLEQFVPQLKAYPKEVEPHAAIETVLEYAEAALTALRNNMTPIELGSDQLFFDLAVSIHEQTKDRALDRLRRFVTNFRL